MTGTLVYVPLEDETNDHTASSLTTDPALYYSSRQRENCELRHSHHQQREG